MTTQAHVFPDLPDLVTRSMLRDRGVRRVDIDRIWQRSPQVIVPGSRVVYVHREHVHRHLVVIQPGQVRP